FFFQAGDGIRDATVTGVQTCALPICGRVRGGRGPGHAAAGVAGAAGAPAGLAGIAGPGSGMAGATWGGGGAAGFEAATTPAALRSEERRVGKEGRTRRTEGH